MAADERIVIYHTPACSKSRGALEILRERGAEFDVVEYLKTPLAKAGLEKVLGLIEDAPAELVRKDKDFKDLGWMRVTTPPKMRSCGYSASIPS